MAINYNDSRFTDIKNEEKAALNQSNSTYDSLINQSSKYYDNLIAQSKDAAAKQTELQNQQTEFAVQKIEQQKEQAAKDYTKEQKGAYQDYMRQSNAYGSNMQTAGQKGLGGSGWSETIQAGFYNTYQNRYAQARENYNTIVMNYDNNIKDAQLQNSSALLQIYNQAQQEQLELALQNFTVIKDLSIAKSDKAFAIDSEYNNRWRQVESQINTENALAEEIRQYNASLAEQKRQADMDQKYRNQQLALQKQELAQQQSQWQKEFNARYGSGGGSGSGSGGATLTSGGSSKKSSTNTGKYSTYKVGSNSKKKTNGNASKTSKYTLTNNSKKKTSTKKTSSKSTKTKGWTPAAKMANSLGLPAAVNLDNILSKSLYDKKVVNGFGYYKKK